MDIKIGIIEKSKISTDYIKQTAAVDCLVCEVYFNNVNRNIEQVFR